MFQKFRHFTVVKGPNLAYCTGGQAVTGGVPMNEKGCITMMIKLGGFRRGQVYLWELDLRHSIHAATCGPWGYGAEMYGSRHDWPAERCGDDFASLFRPCRNEVILTSLRIDMEFNEGP